MQILEKLLAIEEKLYEKLLDIRYEEMIFINNLKNLRMLLYSQKTILNYLDRFLIKNKLNEKEINYLLKIEKKEKYKN